MSDITILFGAGADQQVGLSGGADFAKAVIGLGCSDLTLALKTYYRNCDIGKWYPDYRNVNTDEEWSNRKLIEASVRKEFLSKDYPSKRSLEDAVKKKVDQLVLDKNKANEQLNSFTSYMGLIDGDFHTLINPSILGSGKFWRVVLFYSRAYYYLLHEMNPSVGYDELIGNPIKALEVMNSFSDGLIGKQDSYYSVLSGRKDVNVITTNYTNTCERISGLKEERIAYIHGKFGWFESAEEMRVYDAFNEKLPSGLLFPFIFIQSGVKPIICVKQLKEYMKMVKFLDQSSILFIIGYRINSDDNHIASFIRQYLDTGKRIIYFDFDGSSEEAILTRLRTDTKKGFEHINVNRDNSVKVFERFLSNL